MTKLSEIKVQCSGCNRVVTMQEAGDWFDPPASFFIHDEDSGTSRPVRAMMVGADEWGMCQACHAKEST